MFLRAQRAFFALCLLSICSCTSPTLRQWEIQEVQTKTPCFNAGKLMLRSEASHCHLELEMMRNRSGIRFYVNILLLQALPHKDDPTRTTLEILFENQEPWIVYPYLLEGGQRLLLPGDVADTLIKALIEDYTFTIQIGRYRLLVIPNNFIDVYNRLMTLPIEEDVYEEVSLPVENMLYPK